MSDEFWKVAKKKGYRVHWWDIYEVIWIVAGWTAAPFAIVIGLVYIKIFLKEKI